VDCELMKKITKFKIEKTMLSQDQANSTHQPAGLVSFLLTYPSLLELTIKHKSFNIFDARSILPRWSWLDPSSYRGGINGWLKQGQNYAKKVSKECHFDYRGLGGIIESLREIIKLPTRPLSEHQVSTHKLQIKLKIVNSRGGEGAAVSQWELNYLSQTPEDLGTLTQEGDFSVGFDVPISSNATFNWWIIN